MQYVLSIIQFSEADLLSAYLLYLYSEQRGKPGIGWSDTILWWVPWPSVWRWISISQSNGWKFKRWRTRTRKENMQNTVWHIQAKVHPVTASISVKFWEIKETLVSLNVKRVISVPLTVLEIFAWIVALSSQEFIFAFHVFPSHLRYR